MAQVTSQLLKGFSGKLGNLVFRNINGKTIACQYRKPKTSYSPAAMKAREKFSLMIKFLKPLRLLIRQSNVDQKIGMHSFNKIFSENRRGAILDNYPELKIDYPKVILSKGRHTIAEEFSISSRRKGKLNVQWKYSGKKDKARLNDQAFVACYCEELGSWKYELQLATRKTRTCTLILEYFQGKNVHVYFGFTSSEGETFNSRYLGSVHIK